MSFLRDLDEKYVPRLAAALDRVARKFPRAPEPAGPAPLILRLRRLDDRWTSAGPLALLRDVPQLGAVAIGALVLASGITVASRQPDPAAPRPGTSIDGGNGEEVVGGTLGPDIGESVPEYVETTNARLRTVAPGRPDGMAVAVVMLKDYRTAAQVRDLVGPVQVRKLFYRAPLDLPNGIPREADVEDLVVDSRREFRRVAELREEEAKELRKVAATIEGDPAQKREHERDAALYTQEARLFKGRCECVYGVVVRARLRLLVDLLNLPSVRAVDVSDADAPLDAFTFTALLPEETHTFTNGNEE